MVPLFVILGKSRGFHSAGGFHFNPGLVTPLVLRVWFNLCCMLKFPFLNWIPSNLSRKEKSSKFNRHEWYTENSGLALLPCMTVDIGRGSIAFVRPIHLSSNMQVQMNAISVLLTFYIVLFSSKTMHLQGKNNNGHSVLFWSKCSDFSDFKW